MLTYQSDGALGIESKSLILPESLHYGMVEAVQMLARTEGLLLDPVYSGKGMAGLIDLIRIQIHTVPGPESGKGYLTVRPALAIPFSCVARHNSNSHQ